MWSNYHFETNIFLSKTDKIQIEKENNIKFLQRNFKLFNSKNLFEYGDFYSDFSQFVLGTNLDGFNFELIPKPKQKYKIIFAKKSKDEVSPETLVRYVLGAKTDFNFFKNSRLFNDSRLGIQYCNFMMI